MKFEEIDIPEMERQRYESIKRTGEYMEVNILVGGENEELGEGLVSKMPVVSTCMRNCGPQEVACMYMTLQELVKKLRKDYPSECFAAEMSMRVEDAGSVDTEED